MKNPLLTLIISALVITNVLFFIDEGYYDFRWMANISNWIIFTVYSILIFASQYFIYRVVLMNYKSNGKAGLSILGGTTLFIVALFALHTQ